MKDIYLKIILIQFLVCSLPLSLFAQSFVYQKKFTTGGMSHLSSIMACSDTGNIFSSLVYPSSSFTHQEINLTKFDKYGNISWSKVYGDGLNTDWLYNPIRTIDNGFFGTGQHSGAFTGAGSGEMLAFKIDSVGNIVWVKVIGTPRNEFGIRAIELSDSSLVLMGGSIGNGNNDRDFLFVRLDYYGNLISSKNYGDSLFDEGTTVSLTENGGFMLCGYKKNSGVTQPDIFLVKVDSIGSVVWSKTYGTLNTEKPISITPTLDLGFLILGLTASGNNWKGLSIKIDVNGNVLWSKIYDQSGAYLFFQTCIQQLDSTFLISGTAIGSFMTKMDSNGDIIWFKTYNTYIGTDCCINENGDISFATTGTLDTLAIVRTDPNGNSCSQNTAPINIANYSLTANNVITYSGDTGMIANYIIPVATYLPYNQFDCITTSIEIPVIKNFEFNVFPNPTKGSFRISFGRVVIGATVKVQNLFGETVYHENVYANLEKEINLKNVPSGIYFVKLCDGENIYCKKIIVEHD